MELVISMYLPDVDALSLEIDELVKSYAEACWIEKRNFDLLAKAINTGFWGEKEE